MSLQLSISITLVTEAILVSEPMVSAKPEFSDAGPADGAFEPDEGADNAAIRIVLADSQAIYRVGIRKIFALEDDIRVVAQADSLENLRSSLERHPADVVLI